MSGYRVVHYDGDKIVGLSKWQGKQEMLSSTFDLWTNIFKWNCVVMEDDQISEVIMKGRK